MVEKNNNLKKLILQEIKKILNESEDDFPKPGQKFRNNEKWVSRLYHGKRGMEPTYSTYEIVSIEGGVVKLKGQTGMKEMTMKQFTSLMNSQSDYAKLILIDDDEYESENRKIEYDPY